MHFMWRLQLSSPKAKRQEYSGENITAFVVLRVSFNTYHWRRNNNLLNIFVQYEGMVWLPQSQKICTVACRSWRRKRRLSWKSKSCYKTNWTGWRYESVSHHCGWVGVWLPAVYGLHYILLCLSVWRRWTEIYHQCSKRRWNLWKPSGVWGKPRQLLISLSDLCHAHKARVLASKSQLKRINILFGQGVFIVQSFTV